jgi:hypothetical protein
MTPRFLALLNKKIGEELATRERDIRTGQPENYARYREAVGVIKGLETVASLITEAVDEINKEG